MTGAVSTAVHDLVREAATLYADDPVVLRALETYERRLQEPLRVAVAGMVKAGKSTLLNAIIGEEIAPTDTGECTKVLTWYRYSDTPRITLYPVIGSPRALPVIRNDGRLTLDLGQTRAEEVERLVVDWPAKKLRDITLIDTPGIASLSTEVSMRSTDFLTPEDAPSEADAIIYLMRHLHAADLNFLESFRDTTVGQSNAINALAVLSRADEIGAGRIDSLLSAKEIADRYRRDGTLRAVALGVVPMAGLLAQSARSLRQTEFTALATLSRLGRAERERLMISVDRFVRPTEGVDVSPEVRAALLDRFGLFGIRLASALLRGGFDDATDLAHELARRSGLDELLRFIGVQFQARAAHLKARATLVGVDTVLRAHPRAGTQQLAASIERIQSSAHEFRELRLLAAARTAGLPVAPELAEEAERLIGGQGVALPIRLGVAEDAPAAELRSVAMAALQRWRTLAESPATDRAGAEVCEIVVRSCEAALAQIPAESGGRERVRLVLGPEPTAGPGEQAGDEPGPGQHQLRHQE
ncbi:dynamin family protein [Glaciibacter superstes]|uniref:dynamin family protein n=1 Tax=Glaciibacter superstes TaxID=501023 RepID=UPI0003B39E0F|nr:dynamin family protein [Glaciibacter superstes]